MISRLARDTAEDGSRRAVKVSQTIGRVIRKGNANKVYGLVCVPVYSNVGISTARKVEAVVDTIFNKGEAATSIVTR